MGFQGAKALWVWIAAYQLVQTRGKSAFALNFQGTETQIKSLFGILLRVLHEFIAESSQDNEHFLLPICFFATT